MTNKPRFLKISRSEKIFFCQQLSLMLRSGISLLDALNFFSNQNISKSFAYVIKILQEDLNRGLSINSSLRKFQKQFGDFFINLIQIGEASGNLAQNLDYIALVLRKENEARNKIISMLIYPAFIFGGTILLSILFIFFVFPRLLPVLKELNVKLPLITKIFIAVSTFILNKWPFILIALAMTIIIFYLLLSIRKIKFYFHKILLSLPIIKNIIRQSTLVGFCRNLGLLMSSGVDIISSLEISTSTINNLYYRKTLTEIKDMLKDGHRLEDLLNQNIRYFDPVFVNLINVGEKSGNLEEVLLHLADYYEDTLDNSLKRFLSILEPVILMLMGVVVAF
ncbi:MAG: type II secretion system F family protein, partial [Patescibacteria group bacterium]|nr:type II secretion system F family protein [Patescibacteria group bacterium]